MTNERRLASALLLYCQDHDGRLPPPEYRAAGGEWRHWFELVQAYVPREEALVCPSAQIEGARAAPHGYNFPTSYALNGRFFGTFSPGAFPLENLELPGETVLFVEAGAFLQPMPGGSSRLSIESIYRDVAGKAHAYPARHGGKMNVAAADGHIMSITPVYDPPGNHDPLYGRLGGTIYNWNGGHPNGDTSGPPRE